MEEYSDDWIGPVGQIYVRDLRSTPPPPSCADKFLVVFNLCCKSTTSHWVLHDDGSWPTLAIDAHLPPLRTVVSITIRDFVFSKARSMMQEALRDWPIPAPKLSIMIFEALLEGWRGVWSMPEGHSHLYMNVDFTFTHIVAPAVEEDFMAEYEPRMVPSDDSSIQALLEKQVVIMSTNSETCSVCLEEFLEGSLAVPMPCQHLFHQDCIVGWLRTSHSCPHCRFEMPAATRI